jgi:phage/plasmid-associated DNA primase
MGEPKTPPADNDKGGDKKTKIKQQQYDGMMEAYNFARFRNSVLVEVDDRYKQLTSDLFAQLMYKVYKFATIAQIREVEHLIRAYAPDLSDQGHLIDFNGNTWDTRELEITSPSPTVLRSRVAPSPDHRKLAFRYMLELADHNEELAWDMLQGLAPLFMDRKPAGVIWFVGGGANGKSALINAVYKIIGEHLASMTVSRIEDGRDTPRLNGVIGNVCRESSEGRVEDTERYKAIGTHEPFEVHKFHSQDSITIYPNFHTVFNANNIPIFSDKTEGARRRTLIIPFPARFRDDPTFEERTFTTKFLSGLLSLILDATHIIRDNNYQYRFSAATMGAKADYDSEVNSAEAFLEHLRMNKVRAFTNYHLLKMSYENWCSDNGLVPLGITNLKRVMTQLAKANSLTMRQEGVVKRLYFIDGANGKEELVSLDNGMQVGLKVEESNKATAPVPKNEQSQLGKDW